MDSPDAQWDVRDIEKHLLQMVGNHNIETVSATTGGSYALVCFPCFKQIISFDSWGVSGHRNHIAISKCLRYMIM